MSEDDTDIIVQDGHGSARVDRDRRAPRFSWTPAYETTLFRSLCESVQLGLRENSSFKAEAWERAVEALQDTHDAFPTKSHLINKSDNARKRFRLWRGLRENPDFTYNPMTRTVTATNEAWKAHIEREPLSRALRGRPFDHEAYMEVLYPDVIGSGGAPKRIMKPRKRSDGQAIDDAEMPGPGILSLQGDSSSAPALLDSPGLVRDSPPVQVPVPTAPSPGSGDMQRAGSMGIPSTTLVGQGSALTPPDEAVPHIRKHRLTTSSIPENMESGRARPHSASNKSTAPSSPDKRRRTSFSIDEVTLPSLTRLNTSMGPAPAVASNPVTLNAKSPWAETESRLQAILEEATHLLRARGVRRWREEAVDLFFRDFSDETPDAQIKVTETILSDEHRAMLFCKMPLKLRQHWVSRLGETSL